MQKFIFFFSFAVLTFAAALGQTAQVHIPLNVYDNGGSNIMGVGLDLTATAGIDPHLGEGDLPPVPPVGVFDSRFLLAGGLSSWLDYRNAPSWPHTGNVQHTLQWQFSSGSTSLNVNYILPSGATMQIIDPAGGGFFNSGILTGSGIYTFTPPSFLNIAYVNMVYTNISPGATAPTAPFITSAIADTHSCALAWNDLSNNEAGFKIERKLGDTLSANPWVLIDSVLANVVTFTDTGLTALTIYSYRIYAFNSAGNSPNSNQVQVTTLVPVELTSFTSTQNGTVVLLSWRTATELNNRGFEIERSKNSTGFWKIGFVDGYGTTTDPKSYTFTDSKVETGTYSYRLKQIDYDGKFSYSNIIEVEVKLTPKEFTLFQNYPNPFNPSTIIRYGVPFSGYVKIEIFNMLGESAGIIVNGIQEPGYYELNWNAGHLASGIYLYRLEAKAAKASEEQNFISTKKMMLVR